MLADCQCRPAGKDETTRLGANQFVTVVERDHYRTLEGKIELYDGRPLANALVEVLDQPGLLKPRTPEEQIAKA